ncbi:PadR family transcriptional regulator [Smaragdicoccus niigatensis]|uniref:PadR family transcriptional regulator n=1 Tax=Smaragdicoccus niigatensis TaxID=359359 RepID=UPI000377A69E|nr:PadR family transcriptional regulator [Smaragdicoccus niigatensis]
MSLPHAILTALLEKPSSGLEVARRFDKSIGYFWSATHQQIYREMNKLEAAGLIRARDTEVAAQGQRKTYEVLPEGRDELVRWVGESHDPRPLRDPLLLRLRAAATVGIGGLEVELERLLALHQDELQTYLGIEQRDFAGELTDAGKLQHIVLQAGIGMRVFWVEWLTSALETVRNLEG